MTWLVSVVVAVLGLAPLAWCQVGLVDEDFPYNESDPVVGSWLGQVFLNRGPSAIALDVHREMDGTLSAFISIPRVSVYQQPCTNVQYKEGELTARLPDVRGGQGAAIQYVIRMNAKPAADGQMLEGQITFEVVSRGAPQTPDADLQLYRTPRAYDLDSAISLSGFVDPDGARFPVTFVIAETPEGNFVGHMDVPQNGLFGLFTYDIIFEDDFYHALTSDRAPISIDVESEDGQTWEGVFRRESEKKVVLTRDPYASYEIRYRNSRRQMMSGRLTVPSSEGPYPCAVIVSTFGPHDRDGLTTTHKALAYQRLGDDLTRHGFAVLTIDERGMRRSEGDFNEASTADFARDINLAIAEVKHFATIDQDRIGIIGHGEGGVVAALVNAIGHHKLAFIALLGGPIDFGKSVLMYQQGQAMDFAEEHSEVKRANLQIINGIIDGVRNDIGESAIREALTMELERHRKSLSPETLSKLPPLEEEVTQRMAPFMNNWTAYWVKLNVPAMFEQVECPIYAAYGSLDRQVDPNANAALLENLAAKRGIDVRIRRYEGLNHLFQQAQTGDVTEYSTLGEPFVDPVLNDLVEWLKLVVAR